MGNRGRIIGNDKMPFLLLFGGERGNRIETNFYNAFKKEMPGEDRIFKGNSFQSLGR